MADLTTLLAVKDVLGLAPEETSSDDKIKRLITSESARFVSLTGNPILSASYTETRNGTGQRWMIPLRYPVISVTSVTVDGATIPARATVNDSGWVLVEDRVELVGYTFQRGVGNVVLVYTAGYETAPADVDQAVADLVARKMKEQPRIGLMSQSVGGETVSYQTLTVPENIQSVIDAYLRPRI